MTVPTTRPRSDSGESVAAKGTRICAITEVRPMTPAAAMKDPMEGAAAAAARPPTVMTASVVISRRRSKRSPSGSSRMRPAA